MCLEVLMVRSAPSSPFFPLPSQTSRGVAGPVGKSRKARASHTRRGFTGQRLTAGGVALNELFGGAQSVQGLITQEQLNGVDQLNACVCDCPPPPEVCTPDVALAGLLHTRCCQCQRVLIR